MHRVLPAAPFRAAILVMSGLVGCSDNYFLFDKNNSLPFMLADAGYDVFLGNQRGCAYSRKHKKWTRKDREYWRFTMDDVALYDLPPLVELTQRLSGQRRLFFVGYSASGHSLYVLMHLRPDLRDSFRAAFLMAPSVVFTGRLSPANKAVSSMPDRAFRLMAENADEMMGRSPGFVRLVGEACGVNASKQMRGVCISTSQVLFNLNAKKMDIKNLDFALVHGICGTSSMVVAHYFQMVKSKKLQAFDWGPKENLRQYGTEKPPEHLLQNITLPIALFIGRGDTQVAVEDAQTLGRKSSRNLGVFVIPDEDWDHLDYITNRRAPRLIYDRILAMLPDF